MRRGTAATVRVDSDHLGQHLVLEGRLDARTVGDVRVHLHAIIDHGSGPITLDLALVEIGDATGLGLMLECYRRIRRHGRTLHVVAMTDRTRRLFRGIRLDRALGPA